MTIRRVLMMGQDKGGSGKSLVVRALAESVVTARIIELEDEKRLIELEDRVDFFPVRRSGARSTAPRAPRPAANMTPCSTRWRASPLRVLLHLSN